MTKRLAPPSPQERARLQFALEHFNAGRLDNAEASALSLLADRPGDGVLLNLLAGVAFKRGDFARAAEHLRIAATAAPKDAMIAFNLGEALRRSGDPKGSVPHYKRAKTLNRTMFAADVFRGEALRALGDAAGARKAYEAGLAAMPNHPIALNGLGLLRLQAGDAAGAAKFFNKAIATDAPELGPVWANLGAAFSRLGRTHEAIAAFLKAVEQAPGNDQAWRALSSAMRNVRELPDLPGLRDALIAMFKRVDVNPRSLTTAALAHLHARHGFCAGVDASYEALLGDELFLLMIANAPVPDCDVELLLTALRARAMHAHANGEDAGPSLEVTCALASQCFLNEYVYFVEDDEAALVEALVDKRDWRAAALLACYKPLKDTPFAKSDFSEAPAPVAALARLQIEAPAQERALMAELETLKPVADAVSTLVQSQYEENPYPRWTQCDLATPAPFADVVRAALPHLSKSDAPDIEAPEILIAGCGTGLQTMRVSQSYKNANVLAVDLSRASIAYGMRKLGEYGVTNVRHMQADILDLGALEQRFDFIESFGVIHHMEAPERGLEVLAGLLKPGGLIFLGIYSTIGRQQIVATRDWIAAQGYAPTPEDIRRARRDIMRDQPEEMRALLSPASDFWTMSDCRDLIFHVQEHRYTLPEIGEMLDANGLAFLGLGMPNAADRNAFAAEHAAPGDARSISAYHAFETAHPNAFGETYHIWARKT